MIDEELTGQIIQVYYKVYNKLGYGFLEKIYRNAMTIELAKNGLVIEVEKPIAVFYEHNVVGTFAADLVVGEKIILELKAKESLHPAHEAQLLNYLRATDLELGLLFNFGRQPEFKRKYFSNEKKKRPKHGNNILRNLLSDDPFESA